MKYYRSNAIYEYIIKNNLQNFKFVIGDAWQLVYGDNACNPLLLILAVGVPQSEIENALSGNEIDAFNILLTVGQSANIPVRYIRFACDIDEIESVVVCDNSFAYSKLSLTELSKLYGSFDLPISDSQTSKYINDRSSSAYHNWQRSSLGAALTVSDIDLWKINDKGYPKLICELKRSYYSLESWQPFHADYRNFQLISNLCNRSGIQFKIIYNQRTTNPFEDKIDRLKIFRVDFSIYPPITENGIIMLSELENL